MRWEMCIFLYCVFVPIGISQSYQINDLNSLYDQFVFERANMNAIDAGYKLVEGTPYLNDKFITGEVILNDSIQIKEVPLRYNIYSDRIQFMSDKNIILEVDPSTTLTAKIEEHKFIICDYMDGAEEKRGVLELLIDGEVRLYRKYDVVFKEATKAIGYKDPEPDRFEWKEERYLIAIGQGIPEFITGKKDFFQKLKRVQPDIEAYARAHRLKPKFGKGLVKLIEICNY